MRSKHFVIATLVAAFAMGTATARELRVASPGGRVSIVISDNDGLRCAVLHGADTLMHPSLIGMNIAGGLDLSQSARLSTARPVHHREVITAPFYRQPEFTADYNEMRLSLGKGFGIILRAYDEGVAYRFFTTRTKETLVLGETARYTFGGEEKAWLSHTTNEKEPYAMAFQNVYATTPLDSASSVPAFLPATIDCGRAKVTILESDVVSYPGMFLSACGNELSAEFAPYPKTMDYYPWRHMSHVTATHDFIARSNGAREYPWRVFAVTEHDTEMPVNNLVYALARPNRIGDTAWIKPGKVAWDWWNDWNLTGVDFVAGINYDTYKYYIDFAASHHMPYIVLDEGWYDSNRGDLMYPIDAIRLPELIAYGKQRGVDIVLWTVFNVIDEHLDEACSHYAAMGIKGFKVDFMDRNDQTAFEMVERLAACCARHKLLLDLHGIYTPVGLNRTYPNVLNYESVFGMEEARWTTISDHDMPRYDVTFPYIRMMAGQVDFTPGAMRNASAQDWMPIYRKPMSMGTRCHQAACYVVQDSPFTMLADSPTSYAADEPYTHFIASIPDTWHETRILQGKLGEYIVTARRHGDDWYIGGQTNWTERSIDIDLSTLGISPDSDIQLLSDGVNANHDAEDYRLETLKAGNLGTLHLASGGGFVIKASPSALPRREGAEE